jgi:transposase
MTTKTQRDALILDIDTAVSEGSRLKEACGLVGITTRTYERWNANPHGDKRPGVEKHHPNTLSEEERQKIIDVCNRPEYMDMPPNKIVPILAENGLYIASESSFYKVLREHKLLNHRANTKPSTPRVPPEELVACGPNQVYSWDITYLRTPIKGAFFYLYLFMDIWGRMIVGWQIEAEESGEVSSQIIREICDGLDTEHIYLHSDNGGPMKCGTMLATLNWLGVTPSFSRPSVSNDNAFSESLFKTLKYKPGYPKQFNTIEEVREW